MPPQTNATVTAVTGQGRPDDWDTAAAPGAAKWNGAVRAYYRERMDRVAGAGTVTVVMRRELIVDIADLDAMGLDTDDVLTFDVDGTGPHTGTAKAIPRTALDGIPAELQTSRMVLEDVAAVAA